MTFAPLVSSFLGGLLIGASASLAYVGANRVVGISGILGSLVDAPAARSRARAFELAFLAGLVVVGALVARHAPDRIVASEAPMARVALGGVLVGFGTRLANGCTSGHGVCGISKRSARSLAATATFVAMGVITVGLHRVVFGGVP